MEKQTLKRLIIIVIVVIILVVTLFCADMYKILNNKEPMFSIKKGTYEDGGITEYLGIGYKIFKIRKIEYSMDEIKFGSIFSSYETIVGDEVDD